MCPDASPPPDHRTKPRRLVILAALLIICAGLSLAVRLAPYQVDDALIAYRYAANLASGHGPTFNPGRPAVEGFSSPLWTLGLAAAAWVASFRALPTTAMILGGVCLALAVILASLIARRTAWAEDELDPGPGAALVAATLLALTPTMIFYSVTGLETLLFVVLVLMVTGALAGVLRPALGVAAAALLIWVRPEGAWLLVPAVVQVAIQKEIGKWRRLLLPLALALVAGGAALLAVRLGLFGGLFPNTFHAKTPSIATGLGYLGGYFATLPGLGLLLLGCLGAWLGSDTHRGYLGAALAWMLAAVLEGGDWMPLGRFLTPALALLILSASGVATALQKDDRVQRYLSYAGLGIFLLTAGVMGWKSWELGDTAGRTDAQHCRDARVLADWVSTSGAKSVALVDIGRMGFRALNIEIVDLGGLTDRTIAAAPGGLLAKRFDHAYLYDQRRPDLLVIRLSRLPGRDARGRLAPRPQDAIARVEKNLLADPRLNQLYSPLLVLVPQVPREQLYARMVLIRRGVVIASQAMPKTDMLLATELK